LQASVDCSFAQTFRQRVELIGEAGTLVILEPFLPDARFGKRHGTNPPTLLVNGQQLITPAADAYQLMLEDFADAIAQQRAPRFSLEDAVAQARVMHALHDAARAEQPLAIRPESQQEHQ
jgi:predicted dehydrogenase